LDRSASRFPCCSAGAKRKAEQISPDSEIDSAAAPVAASRASASAAGGAGSVAAATSSGASSGKAALKPVPVPEDGLTESQRKHLEARKQRVCHWTVLPLELTQLFIFNYMLQEKALASKMASKSHREKVEELNHYLAALPQHNDIFKISYAGIG
jgi:hypothetical protein